MSGSAPDTSILRTDSRLARRSRTLGYSSSMWGLVTSSPAAAARRRKVSLSSQSWLEMGYHPLNNASSGSQCRWRTAAASPLKSDRGLKADLSTAEGYLRPAEARDWGRPGWWTLWLREAPLAIAVSMLVYCLVDSFASARICDIPSPRLSFRRKPESREALPGSA